MRISDWSSDVCSSDLPDGRVDCCPPTFGPALHDAERIFEELRDGADGLTLIHRRDAWMMNSWLRNLPRMQKGGRTTNPLWMSPDDAAARGLAEGAMVQVHHVHGAPEAVVAFDAALLPRAVATSHGRGNRYQPTLAVAPPPPAPTS